MRDYAKFERTGNLLISRVISTMTSVPDFPQTQLNLKVKVDNRNTKELLSKGKITMQGITVKTRNDGTLSRPDAEVYCENTGFLCCLDAKYYNSELPMKEIKKTLDDMALRETSNGILICSEKTGLNQISKRKTALKDVKIIKLKPGN